MTIRLGQRRYDETIPVSSVEATPSGGRRLRANLSRVGVFKYRYADGTEVREYRPPEEVLAPASIASWDGVPVTEGHPEGLVTPATYRELARGHVHHPGADGIYVAGGVDVNDAGAIQRVDSKDLHDVSGGYTADFDPTPGVTPDGEPYDGVQRNIRANHLALLPPGAGRQGPTVALRLDADSAIASCITVAPATSTQEKKTMPKIKLDGIECEQGSDTHISILEKQVTTERKRADDAVSAVTVEKKRADDAAALVASTASDLAKEKSRADAAELAASPKTLAKRVAERVGLLSLARQHIGPTYLADAAGAEPGAEAAGKSDDDIIKDVLAKLNGSLDTKSMDHSMLMGALLALCSVSSSEAAVDSVEKIEAAAPVDPAMPSAPTAFDDVHAPRGRIGATNALSANVEQIRTQEQALAEKHRNDAERWRKPVGAHLPQSSQG